MMSAIDRDLN